MAISLCDDRGNVVVQGDPIIVCGLPYTFRSVIFSLEHDDYVVVADVSDDNASQILIHIAMLGPYQLRQGGVVS